MGIGRTTVMNLIASGQLKSSRPSPRRISIRVGDIHDYLAAHETYQPTSRRLLDSVQPMRRVRA